MALNEREAHQHASLSLLLPLLLVSHEGARRRCLLIVNDQDQREERERGLYALDGEEEKGARVSKTTSQLPPRPPAIALVRVVLLSPEGEATKKKERSLLHKAEGNRRRGARHVVHRLSE